MSKIKIVFTDLDRTLLNDNSTFSKQDLQTLRLLGSKNIVRVLITGRNLFSVKKVIDNDFPVDYLIFSSGICIMNWQTKKIIFTEHLNENQSEYITRALIAEKLDFMVHNPLPDNHFFFYYRSSQNNPDFQRRLNLYQKFAHRIKIPIKIQKASQFIAILNYCSGSELFTAVAENFNDFNVIKATSPLDHKSLWLEIFPSNVSKGLSAKRLCNYLNVQKEQSLGIGNDYNDLDLLEWTNYSYVVENAPEELKNKFTVTVSNNKAGFSRVVKQFV